jgi:hypothetical protein
MPMSNAEAARMRRTEQEAALGSSASRFDWRRQPVGGRPAEVVAHNAPSSNPFESRLFGASRAAAQAVMQRGTQRMHGQHGPTMSSLSEFAGAAGVPSSQTTAASVSRAPRVFGAHPDFHLAAGSVSGRVGKDMAIFHQGQQGRHAIAHEGTKRTKELVGAAAAVAVVGSS